MGYGRGAICTTPDCGNNGTQWALGKPRRFGARGAPDPKAILERLYARTIEVIQENREPLAALAIALLERETIEGDEAVEIMEEAGMTRPGWLAEALVAPLAPPRAANAA